jgi:hypothetical protein
MKLLILTQVYENYGDATNPRWKAKGGDDYFVRNVKNDSDATTTVMAVREQIESDNEFLRETIVGWKLVADDYLTEFERSQLEYDGAILYPSKEIIWK